MTCSCSLSIAWQEHTKILRRWLGGGLWKPTASRASVVALRVGDSDGFDPSMAAETAPWGLYIAMEALPLGFGSTHRLRQLLGCC